MRPPGQTVPIVLQEIGRARGPSLFEPGRKRPEREHHLVPIDPVTVKDGQHSVHDKSFGSRPYSSAGTTASASAQELYSRYPGRRSSTRFSFKAAAGQYEGAGGLQRLRAVERKAGVSDLLANSRAETVRSGIDGDPGRYEPIQAMWTHWRYLIHMCRSSCPCHFNQALTTLVRAELSVPAPSAILTADQLSGWIAVRQAIVDSCSSADERYDLTSWLKEAAIWKRFAGIHRIPTSGRRIAASSAVSGFRFLSRRRTQ